MVLLHNLLLKLLVDLRILRGHEGRVGVADIVVGHILLGLIEGRLCGG